MDKLKAKKAKLQRRQRRVRGKVAGTPERPRLRVTRSNTNIYAQVIDDVAAVTLASASSLDKQVKATGKSGGNIEGAAEVGNVPSTRVSARSYLTAAAISTMVVSRRSPRAPAKPA